VTSLTLTEGVANLNARAAVRQRAESPKSQGESTSLPKQAARV
jgi:hypothetical protein